MNIWPAIINNRVHTEFPFDGLTLFHVEGTVMTTVSSQELDHFHWFRATLMERRFRAGGTGFGSGVSRMMELIPPTLVLQCPKAHVNEHGELVL